MQQITDSSTSNLPYHSSSNDSVKYVAAPDSTEIAVSRTDTVFENKPAKTISYITVQRKKFVNDSLQNARDSLRRDSIDQLIDKFESGLRETYSSIPKEAVQYYDGPSRVNNSSWILGMLLLCFLLIAFLRSRYLKRINLLVKCLFNWKLGKQVVRYEQVYSHPVNFVLLGVFAVSLSLFVIHAFSPFQVHRSNVLIAVALCCILFMAIYFFKIIGLLLVGNIFQIQDATKEYVFHTLLLLKFSGVFMLPVLVLLFYSSINPNLIISIGLSIILLSFLIRIYRGVMIGLQLNERPLSIILYLCTLEILPALVIAEFLNDLYFS